VQARSEIEAAKVVGRGTRRAPPESRATTRSRAWQAPGIEGVACADYGCRYGLEGDHVNPVANNGETSDSNLEARCWVAIKPRPSVSAKPGSSGQGRHERLARAGGRADGEVSAA
jgi:hypothetical protein